MHTKRRRACWACPLLPIFGFELSDAGAFDPNEVFDWAEHIVGAIPFVEFLELGAGTFPTT